MSYNPHHAQEVDASSQRSTAEVFKSATVSKQIEDGIKSRFASSGRFTSEQLEAGSEPAVPASTEPEFDPDDNRSLYDRLKEQRDAKQEEWEHKHTFKNQMDHWRLDEDEAAFEDERREQLRAQEAESARLRDEGAEFYKLARAAREHPVKPVSASSTSAPWGGRAAEKRKQERPASRAPAFKVLRADTHASTSDAPAPAQPAAMSADARASAVSTLPGMGAYSASSDDDE